MKYMNAEEVSKKWNISIRSVRNYAYLGRIEGAYLDKKRWFIPENANKPKRISNKKKSPSLLDILLQEKKVKIKGGIYHKIQIELTYNSNRIEGSSLTLNQTSYIFDTNLIDLEGVVVNVDDILETANHFRCIDIVIDNAKRKLSEDLIKKLHLILKNGTSQSRLDYFNVGGYKKVPNQIGDRVTTSPSKVPIEMKKLLEEYEGKKNKTLDDLLDFHAKFESIHPFADGNGRIGRLILFKECLKYNIVPFIIDEQLKLFYSRGLNEWDYERGYLRDTCLTAQDTFKTYLDYFEISYQ